MYCCGAIGYSVQLKLERGDMTYAEVVPSAEVRTSLEKSVKTREKNHVKKNIRRTLTVRRGHVRRIWYGLHVRCWNKCTRRDTRHAGHHWLSS